MWLYFCYSLVFAHVFASNWAQNDKKLAVEPTTEAEGLFAGVMKNISRVNNVLQELINNYEQLQKIYKSQENLDSASSDSEIDEVYKSNKKKQSRAEANTVQPVGFSSATQMIWSDNNGKGEADSIVSDDNDEERRNKATDDQDEKSSDENQTTKYESDKSIKSDEQEKSESDKTPPAHKKPKEPEILDQQLVKPKQAEIVFIDTHKNTSSAEQNRWTKAAEISVQSSRAPKTRYSKIPHIRPESNNNKLRHKIKSKHELDQRSLNTNKVSKSEPSNNRNNNETRDDEINNNEPSMTVPNSKPLKNTIEIKRNVEKKIHSESFPFKDFWGDIMSNKPIMLEDHNDMVAQKVEKKDSDSKRAIMRSGDHKPKTALVIVTNKNRTRVINKSEHKPTDTDEADSAEEASNDEFRAKILRQAYGDACLKLEIRRCYKACKKASKSVCDHYKCTSIFKTAFNNFSKTACLEQYVEKRKQQPNERETINGNRHKNRDHKTSNNDRSGIVDIPQFRTFDTTEPNIKRKKVERVEEYFVDITREGYLQACLPHVSQELKTDGSKVKLRFRKETPSANDSIGRGLNILREKYEEECKKVSYNKCRAACEKSYKQTCEAYQCIRDKKKAYDKACKQECKKTYKLKRSDGSGSGSSGSDASSNSDQ